jgi:NDP-sugar pyrophosphorylase family protein
MVLAAGLGTRLQPLTDDRPKALVELGGRTLLELTLARLRSFGIHDVIVNTHHFGDKIAGYLRANDNFGMHIEISREEILLDTGGGLKNAAQFFLSEGRDLDEPFLLHNVDVLSNIDFGSMLEEHRRRGALATLAMQDRATSRPLLFDENGLLCGRRLAANGADEIVRQSGKKLPLAFAGIHVISTRIFPLMNEGDAFSIIPTYLRLAREGESIAAFRADKYYWRDLGRPQQIADAVQDIESGRYS